MILVTGATGFVGRQLIPRLVENGEDVRALIRPSQKEPNLPRGLPLQVAVSGLVGFREIRAALVGVDTVVHLASAEKTGDPKALKEVDYEGTRRLLEASEEVGIKRFVYISHLGANSASAFPLYRVKGRIEEMILQSRVPYTIVKTSLLHGPEDRFTTLLSALAHVSPGVFFLPGDGQIRLQPLWVDDLVTCIEWSLDDPGLVRQVVSVGGPEFLSLQNIAELVMSQSGRRRRIVPMPVPYVRFLTRMFRRRYKNTALSSLWLDHFAVNRACELHSVMRYFGLRPARLEQSLQLPEKVGLFRNWRYLSQGTSIVD